MNYEGAKIRKNIKENLYRKIITKGTKINNLFGSWGHEYGYNSRGIHRSLD